MTAARARLLGVCYGGASSFARGPALAPAAIRAFLRRPSSNGFSEAGLDVLEPGVLEDAGDVTPGDGPNGRAAIERAVLALPHDGAGPLLLAATIPSPIRCSGRCDSGTRPSRSSTSTPIPTSTTRWMATASRTPVRWLACWRTDLVDRLVQIGIRTMTGHQRDQARRWRVEVHEMKDWTGPPALSFEQPVYVSFDLDALDPAFAPGVSHPEPSPNTGMVTAKLVKELVARLGH